MMGLSEIVVLGVIVVMLVFVGFVVVFGGL